jgi:hypothetical protein
MAIFVWKLIIYKSMLFCWEWTILKSSARILWCDIHAISHKKSIEDINLWFGGWWHGVQWMVTWRIVDDDVECLHVERNPTMTCSGSHLYKFYRFQQNLQQDTSTFPQLVSTFTYVLGPRKFMTLGLRSHHTTDLFNVRWAGIVNSILGSTVWTYTGPEFFLLSRFAFIWRWDKGS